MAAAKYADIVVEPRQNPPNASLTPITPTSSPSGSQANAAAYMTLLNPGDFITRLGSHAVMAGILRTATSSTSPANSTVSSATRSAKNTETIDYDEARRHCRRREKPKVIVGGGSAFRASSTSRMRAVAGKVGAYLRCRYGTFRRSRSRRSTPLPRPSRPRSHHHNPLNPARASRGISLHQQEFAAGIDRSVFPGQQGGPLLAYHLRPKP